MAHQGRHCVRDPPAHRPRAQLPAAGRLSPGMANDVAESLRRTLKEEGNMKRARILGALGMLALTLSLVHAGVLVTPAAAQGFPWGGGLMGSGGSMGSGGPMDYGGPVGYGGSMGYRQPTAYATPGHVRLYLGDGAFFPAEVSVPAYTRVTWVKGGRSTNTVTSPGIWDSGP